MEEYQLTKQEQLQQRKDIVAGAKAHIKSITHALAKYLRGSNVERGYAMEHSDSLQYYLNKL